MKKFINSPFHVEDEMVDGFVSACGGKIRRSDKFRVVVRTDRQNTQKVGVISGGGSGHEPAILGYVGKGMLDAVAVGDIFSSPPPGAFLEAIHAVDTGQGVLIIIGNYTGDRMNIHIAMDIAKTEGRNVALVITDDDVGSGKNDRRGVAGEFFVWKTSGAMAEQGGTLEECVRIAELTNSHCRTLGVAIAPCTVPAKGTPTFTLRDDEMEYGVGHHGERGMENIKLQPVDRIVERMVAEIIDDLPFKAGDDIAVMVNGLGGTANCELFIIYRKVKQILDEIGINIYMNFIGEYFTALEMAGFSISMLKLNNELKTLLTTPSSSWAFRNHACFD